MKVENNYGEDRIRHHLALRLIKLTNVILICSPFVYVWFNYYLQEVINPFYMKGNVIIIIISLVTYAFFSHLYDGFLISTSKISEIIYSQTLSILISDGIMYVIIVLLARGFPSLIPGIMTIVAQVLLSIIWSVVAHHWYFSKYKPKKTAILYDDDRDLDKVIEQYGLDIKFDVQLVSEAGLCIDGNMKMIEGYDVVFVSGMSSHNRNIILKYCVENGIQAYVVPKVADLFISNATRMHLFHLPVLKVERFNPTIEYLILKRFFDLLISGVSIILFSPILLVTAIAIKYYDKGPALYRQVRLTKDGKQFEILKFRSMRVDAEKNSGAVLSTGDKDDRITPIGRFIRKVRIDELPQLINIFKGDMSIVGPRPERPEIAAKYCETLPEFSLRLQAKAGLTGYAQVYGKYNTSPSDKLKFDLMYIANASVVEDIKIMFATVKILFMKESTEGVTDNKI